MAGGVFNFGIEPNSIEGWCTLSARGCLTAQVLLGAKQTIDAWAHAGLAVECALKASVMAHHRFNRWPSRELRPDLYTHDLKHLAREAGIDFKALVRDPIASHFQTALLWRRTEGYNPNAMPMHVAADMVTSACGPNGVVQWLASRYRLTI